MAMNSSEIGRRMGVLAFGAGWAFDRFILILIILSLLAFSLETLPDIPEHMRAWLKGFEIFIVAIFTVKYTLRIIVADDKPGFVFSFFGTVDLLAILPFYITTCIDSRGVRAFRLLRVAWLSEYPATMILGGCSQRVAAPPVVAPRLRPFAC